jgi:hypothetical protein
MPSPTFSAAPPSSLRGSQEPRIRHVPPFVSSLGREAIELAAVAGLNLDPWQRLVLIDSLGQRPDGRWAAFEVGLVVARQNGKDSILEAMEIAGLFLFGERLIMHSAHKFDTAMEHLERLANLIEAAELQRRIRKINRSHGSEGITLKDGRRIRFRARTTSGGGRGYTGDRVIFNEAMDLPDAIVGAMMPTMSARSSLVPGPQIVYAGSAVDQETMANGLVLARLREAGIAGENERLAYFEWSAPDDADPASWDARAAANPGMGYRITPEYVETEFRSPAMSPRQYAVERMGIGDWPDTGEDAGRVIGREQWAACAETNPENRIVRDHAFGVDVNPDRTWGSIGVAGQRADGLCQFAVADRRRGTDWIVDRCADLNLEHSSAAFVVLARGPAANLIADLRGRGLNVIEASGADYAVACSDFFDAVDHAQARYPDPQPELDDALAGARKGAPAENAWTWSRKASTSPDISPLVAVTLGLWATRTLGIPEVHSIREAVARLRGEQAAEPEPAPAAPESGQTNFIPLDQMPPQRGLFRP